MTECRAIQIFQSYNGNVSILPTKKTTKQMTKQDKILELFSQVFDLPCEEIKRSLTVSFCKK